MASMTKRSILVIGASGRLGPLVLKELLETVPAGEIAVGVLESGP